jgi:NADH-quinone oxidoreductase subunit H
MYFEFTWTHFWITLLLIAAIMAVVQGTCAYLILAERKISAWAQDRLGPNRVGWYGLLQPIADGIKFLLKEQVVPDHVDKLFYFIGPAIAVSTALMAIVVVPVGRTTPPPMLLDRRPTEPGQAFSKTPLGPIWPTTVREKEAVLAADRAWAKATGEKSFEEQLEEYNNTVQFVIAPHVDIGVVLVFAVGSLAAYAIVLGGWSSNNKYSLLGSLRSSAQLISYEIPMGMSVLGVMLVTGSLNIEQMVAYQHQHGWNILFQPLACVLFITSIFAECNRLPFDLPEAEQELVGGYHTEYSGMKFALYFLGEYTHMITTSFLVVALFLGGGQILPFLNWPKLGVIGDSILELVVFAVKMALFICFYMFIRWTIPRFRFDQLMGLAWKVMMPLALLSVVAVLLVQHYRPLGESSHWLLPPISLAILIGAAALSVRLPRGPGSVRMHVRGHPVTGTLVPR